MTRQDGRGGNRPFWAETQARTIRRGHLWVPGDRVERDGWCRPTPPRRRPPTLRSSGCGSARSGARRLFAAAD